MPLEPLHHSPEQFKNYYDSVFTDNQRGAVEPAQVRRLVEGIFRNYQHAGSLLLNETEVAARTGTIPRSEKGIIFLYVFGRLPAVTETFFENNDPNRPSTRIVSPDRCVHLHPQLKTDVPSIYDIDILTQVRSGTINTVWAAGTAIGKGPGSDIRLKFGHFIHGESKDRYFHYLARYNLQELEGLADRGIEVTLSYPIRHSFLQYTNTHCRVYAGNTGTASSNIRLQNHPLNSYNDCLGAWALSDSKFPLIAPS